MASALPIVSDCRASCACTTTLNVTQLIADSVATAIALAVEEAIATVAHLVFNNLLELRAFTGYLDKSWCLLRDLEVFQDGMGGEYTFYAASMEVDDGISIIQPDNIAAGFPGRWIKEI